MGKPEQALEQSEANGVQVEGGMDGARTNGRSVDRQAIGGPPESGKMKRGKGRGEEHGRECSVKKGKAGKHAVTLLKPRSVFSEYFRVIRNHILYRAQGKNARVLLVTSAMPKEGKSFVASNLAVSLASGQDRPVLLIDADFRKPSLHATFGFGSTRGLSDLLADERYPLSILVRKTSIPKLDVLPAGTCDECSPELLDSQAMRSFVQQVKREDEARYIILDAPPIQMAETLALREVADGTVLVVKAGGTDRRTVKRTVDSIGADYILGIVLNYASSKKNSYYGYYYKKGR